MSISNKEQIDAYSRYMHSLSLTAIISSVGLLFSDGGVLLVAEKFIALVIFAILLFIYGLRVLNNFNEK